ncbi:MAG: hypothetical protein ACOYYS_11690 [Chloroflexota bacterium]
MFPFTAHGYQTFLRQHLDRLTPLLVAELREILSWHCWQEDVCLRVDVFSGDLSGPLPMSASLYRRREKLCFWKLARPVLHVLPPEAAVLSRRFDEAGVEITEVALQSLIEWFADCWQQAGGRLCSLVACIGIPGDIEALDLKRGEWIQVNAEKKREKNLHRRKT